MVIRADDWFFLEPGNEGCVVKCDLFLDNGQHARLEVIPLMNPCVGGEMIPEIIVDCEMPGEKLNGAPAHRRWLSRPPDSSCEWSRVELPSTLIRLINERLEASLQAA